MNRVEFAIGKACEALGSLAVRRATIVLPEDEFDLLAMAQPESIRTDAGTMFLFEMSGCRLRIMRGNEWGEP